jgi:hypothetical protein
MTILPALSSATISSVEARVFCIAFYFKLSSSFSGYIVRSSRNREDIHSISGLSDE